MFTDGAGASDGGLVSATINFFHLSESYETAVNTVGPWVLSEHYRSLSLSRSGNGN